MFSFVFVVHLLNVFCRKNFVCNSQGPDEFNGYGYFYVRLYWTGFGFQANIVEEYVLCECITAYLRWFEEDLGSEVVFWSVEWSIEFGHHWFDVAHVHDHSPLSVPVRRY